MEIIYECACGLDVHKDVIVACMIKRGQRVTRSYGSMTGDITELCSWLRLEHCKMTAMESTGVYWKPIYNLFEAQGLPIIVVNAQHMKAVPGRKTDVKDAEWIADLTRHGLLKASYIPAKSQRELREAVRYRKSLIEARSREFNRIQMVLEGANIKLGSVVTDISGVTASEIIDDLIDGKTDPISLAGKARGALKKKLDRLIPSLYGMIGDHQRLILKTMREHVKTLDSLVARLDGEIAQRMYGDNELIERIAEIPGVGARSAQVILAEIGTNMDVFPTVHHLASWAGICPGNYLSAGKKKSSRTRKSNKILKSTLAQCAKSASHARKGSYLASQYKKIAARRGGNRATLAVAHSILSIIYYMIVRGTRYQDLGANYFDERKQREVVERSVRRLKALGYNVMVSPVPAVV